MLEIQRYEVNESGGLPLSYGRYVLWDDVQDKLKEMQEEIERLEDEVAQAESTCCDYDAGHEDGRREGIEEGIRISKSQQATKE